MDGPIDGFGHDRTDPSVEAISTEAFAVGMKTVIEQSSDAIIFTEVETGSIVIVNDTATRLFERKRETLIGMNQSELHPANERASSFQLFCGCARARIGPTTRYDDGSQIHIITGSDTHIPVEINASLVDIGDRTLIQAHFRDISDRLDVERERKVFQRAVEQAGHSIFITDIQGRFEYVNPAFERISGYSEDEVLGKRTSLLKSGVHDDAFYQHLWGTILAGEIWQGELINKSKDGERYVIEQTIAPIHNHTGSIEWFVAVNRDITDRKRRERQLKRERERLEEFASTVTHDLRTPLSLAIGQLDFAMETDPRPEIDRAIEALEQMNELIHELLTLSKQGETVDDASPVDIVECVENAWSHVDTTDASLSIGIDTDHVIDADADRLEILLRNLFTNAVEHGGEWVAVEVVPLDEGEGFAVDDDGSGIDPTHRARIFDAGVSLEQGSGYGLSIVQQIAQAHGWTVEATESPSGGARFAIQIPQAHTE